MIAGMDATRLIVIRHGETEWNASRRLQGHTDVPLSAVGRRQAALLARALAVRGEPIDAIYTSDLARARQTVQALADALALPLTATAGLRERCFGAMEGLTFTEVEARWPDAAEQWRRRTPDWRADAGGESLQDLRRRVLATVDALAAPHRGQQIALFLHGGVLDILYRAATGQDLRAPRTWQLANTAVNRLLWTPQGLNLVGWDDQTHLTTTEDAHEPLDETSA